jgi:hypothetical protein
VARVCNPSYSGGRDQEGHSSESAPGKKFVRTYLGKEKNPKTITKKVWKSGWSSKSACLASWGPKLKPQCHQKKKKKVGSKREQDICSCLLSTPHQTLNSVQSPFVQLSSSKHFWVLHPFPALTLTHARCLTTKPWVWKTVTDCLLSSSFTTAGDRYKMKIWIDYPSALKLQWLFCRHAPL